MRKLAYILPFVVFTFLLAVGAVAGTIPANDKAKEKANPDNPAITDWQLLPPGLEKIEFIHYKDDFGKEAAAKAAKTPSCYKFLTPTKIKWLTLPVGYVVNPTNPQGLGESFITSTVSSSAETWDAATSKELINNAYTVDSSISYGVQDYKNAISFGNYPAAGVIAVTSVWYNPAAKAIVEFDIMLDTDWAWGDVAIDNSKMDLQNIAIHEFGHGVGLGDIYTSACSLVTMYGYSDYGEIIKRTLESADIIGLRTLYGI